MDIVTTIAEQNWSPLAIAALAILVMAWSNNKNRELIAEQNKSHAAAIKEQNDKHATIVKGLTDGANKVALEFNTTTKNHMGDVFRAMTDIGKVLQKIERKLDE